MQKQQDIKHSKILEPFFDKTYKDLDITVKRRITYEKDKDLQVQGVDLIIQENGKDVFVDEKARIDYINKDNIPGFAFEISSINTDKIRRTAWLLSSTSQTHRYHLMTHMKGTIENPTSFEIRSIDKYDLTNGIIKYLPLHRIEQYSEQIISVIESFNDIESSKETIINQLQDIEGVNAVECNDTRFQIKIRELTYQKNENGWFTYTFIKDERPLNLFVKFWYLETICNVKRLWPK